MRRGVRWGAVLAPIVVVVTLAELHAHLIGHYSFTGTGRFGWTIVYIGFLELAAYAAAIPDSPRSTSGAVWTSLAAVAAAATGISLVQLLGGAALLPRAVVLGAALILAPIYVLLTLVDQRGRTRGAGHDRVLAVLSAQDAAALQRDLPYAPERPADLVTVVPPEAASADAPPAGDLPHTPVGTGGVDRRLVHEAARLGVTVLVLGREGQADESVVAQAADLHGRGVRVRTLSLFYDEWLGKLPVSELERTSLMFDIQELHVVSYARVKRAFDLVAGLLGLVVLALAVPVVWSANLVGNRGPLFFHQTRVGKGGRPFTIHKFRTMTAGTDEQAWTEHDDPRVRTLGRWMRRLHVDELPQAVNLLRGDLSMVGPRPEQPHYVAELGSKIPFYDVRHLVKPGVTGWAQVKFPYGASVEDALEKLQYEFWYLRHQGPVLDARVLARTVRSIVRFEGR